MKLNEQELQLLSKALCGFEIGQTVYWQKKNYVMGICTTCGGTHKLVAETTTGTTMVDCPDCNSNGEYEKEIYYTAEPDVLRSVYLSLTNIHPERAFGELEVSLSHITFYLMNKPFEVSGKNIYQTAEEAIAGTKICN